MRITPAAADESTTETRRGPRAMARASGSGGAAVLAGPSRERRGPGRRAKLGASQLGAGVLLALALGTTDVPAADFDTSPFRYLRPVVAANGGTGGTDGSDVLVSIPLDSHLFAETADSFADLRLVRTRGGEAREWPFRIDRLATPPAPPEIRSSATRVVSFDTRDDGSMQLVLEATERDFPAHRIEISTPLRDFEKSLEIAASDDGETWETLVRGALLVDRQRFVDFRRTTVDLPGSRHRYYRLQIDEASDEQRSALREMTRSLSEVAGAATEERSRLERRDFRIDSVRLLRDPENGTAPGEPDTDTYRDYPVEILSIEENPDEQRTEIVIAVGRAPVSEIRLATQERNFRRTLQVEAPLDESKSNDRPRDETRWRSLGRGAIHRYAIEGLAEEQLALGFDELRSGRLRLLIENLDSPPLTVDDVSAAGPAYALRFLSDAESDDLWTLLYGGSTEPERRPRYDLAALSRVLAAGAAPSEWELGEASENSQHVVVVAAAASPWWERPAALYAVIALAVAGLVILLVRAGRGVRDLGEEE